MAFFDWPQDRLVSYLPEREEQPDFDDFWQATLDEAASHPLNATFTPWSGGLDTVDVFDVEFSGFHGQRVKAWLLLPRHRSGRLPGLVQYIGYGGGRGIPYERLAYSAAGYAHLVMDNRGQGGGGKTTADTHDREVSGTAPASPGYLTRGIDDPANHYYRRLITDAVRAVDALAAHPDVDPKRIGVVGGSQGGGLALAVGGLRQDLRAVVADVPFLCHYRRASQVTDAGPYWEVARYLAGNRFEVENVIRTLSYFDGVNFASRATAPGWLSVGLMDKICPPSTVYAAFNHYAADNDLAVFPYNGHEGGGDYGLPRKLAALESSLR